MRIFPITLILMGSEGGLIMTYKVRIDLEFENKPTDIDVIDYLYELLDCDVLRYELVENTEHANNCT